MDLEEVGHKNRFFLGTEIASGQWRQQFEEVPHIIIIMSSTGSVTMYGPYDSREKAEAVIRSKGFSGEPGKSFLKDSSLVFVQELLPMIKWEEK